MTSALTQCWSAGSRGPVTLAGSQHVTGEGTMAAWLCSTLNCFFYSSPRGCHTLPMWAQQCAYIANSIIHLIWYCIHCNTATKPFNVCNFSSVPPLMLLNIFVSECIFKWKQNNKENTVVIINECAQKIWCLFYVSCHSWQNLGLSLQPQDYRTTALTTELLQPPFNDM